MVARVGVIIIIGIMMSGFSWGKKEEVSSVRKPAAVTQEDKTSRVTKASVVQGMPESEAALAGEVAAEGGEFPTRVLSALAQGDEDTRRARIESLKRLSEALRKLNEAKAQDAE